MFFLKDYKGKGNDAGSKARNDCEYILKKNNFEELDFCLGGRKKYITGIFKRKKEISRISKGDILVIQYPYHVRYANKFYNILSNLQKRDIKIIAIIHDILFLRGMDENIKLDEEIQLLNSFDVLISHNKSMTKWLKDKGVTSNIIELEIFDYISEYTKEYMNADFKNIYFAGNLDKSKSEFIYSEKFKNLNIKKYLFGPNYNTINHDLNSIYKGCYNPEELVNYFENGFGLIWDGKSTEKCDGVIGQYMRYNNPHKTSLYLSTGLPVIIWKEAAIAKFIEENKIGITVNSLDDMQYKVDSMTIEEYNKLKENVSKIKEKILGGEYLISALNKASKLLKL